MGGFWVGIDPGGKNAFGVALVLPSGAVKTCCVSCADEAVEWIKETPSGIGIDAPLWWLSGQSSDRMADRWIRKSYGIASGTVQAANSLRGAALVQAAMFVVRAREKFPGVQITETHPKALAFAWGGWESRRTADFLGAVPSIEHERDAVLAAYAAKEGFEGRWTRDLALKRLASEQDPKSYWLAPVSYFWPE